MLPYYTEYLRNMSGWLLESGQIVGRLKKKNKKTMDLGICKMSIIISTSQIHIEDLI